MKAALVAATVLVAAASTAHAASVDFTTLTVNGSAFAIDANTLQLTDAIGGEAGSAFLAPISSNSTFTSSFTFTSAGTDFDPQADGITFIIQNDPAGANALGTGGGGVGAADLTNNLGIGLRSWDNNHATIFTEGDVFNGTQPLGNFNLGDQDDVVDVTLAYDGSLFSYTAFNHTTGFSISDSFAFDLTTLGPKVYLGFTGGTGLSYATQQIHDWDLDVQGGAGVPEPAAWALMLIGFAGMGTALRRRRRLFSAA